MGRTVSWGGLELEVADSSNKRLVDKILKLICAWPVKEREAVLQDAQDFIAAAQTVIVGMGPKDAEALQLRIRGVQDRIEALNRDPKGLDWLLQYAQDNIDAGRTVGACLDLKSAVLQLKIRRNKGEIAANNRAIEEGNLEAAHLRELLAVAEGQEQQLQPQLAAA